MALRDLPAVIYVPFVVITAVVVTVGVTVSHYPGHLQENGRLSEDDSGSKSFR